jgi:hypothetical protein
MTFADIMPPWIYIEAFARPNVELAYRVANPGLSETAVAKLVNEFLFESGR